jgi:hypothetical protein
VCLKESGRSVEAPQPLGCSNDLTDKEESPLNAVKRVLAALAVSAVTVMGVAIGATPASANSSSSSYNYPGGDRLEANIWIQTFSNGNGCGDWSTSAKLWGYNPPTAQWIKNVASFHANGIGASIYNFSAGGSGTDVSASWTNYNTWIADLSGNLCANWLTWYVSGGSSAVSYVPQYGSPRIASASV